MEIWWNNLSVPLQIFYAAGIAAGVALGILLILTLLGADHPDFTSGVDHPDGTGVLSVRSLVGFFFGFGWTGVIAIKSGLGLGVAIGLACVVGAAFLFGIYLLMRGLFAMQASGTLDYRNAVGQVATVYVTVPAARQGLGQVEVLVQGRLQTVSCMTPHPDPLAPQAKVRVVGVIDQGTLEVQPL